jgi:hypothetical protein
MSWLEYRRLARSYRQGRLRDPERLERLLQLCAWADTYSSRELARRVADSLGWTSFMVCLTDDPALAWAREERSWAA